MERDECVGWEGACPGHTLLLSIYWNIIKAYKIVGKTRKTHLCFLSLFTRLHFMPELSTLSAALCGHINLFNHDMTATKLEVSFEIYAFTLFIKLCSKDT